MRIVTLQSDNFKRLKAIEIHPSGSLVTISGRNAQIWLERVGTGDGMGVIIEDGCVVGGGDSAEAESSVDAEPTMFAK